MTCLCFHSGMIENKKIYPVETIQKKVVKCDTLQVKHLTTSINLQSELCYFKSA